MTPNILVWRVFSVWLLPPCVSCLSLCLCLNWTCSCVSWFPTLCFFLHFNLFRFMFYPCVLFPVLFCSFCSLCVCHLDFLSLSCFSPLWLSAPVLMCSTGVQLPLPSLCMSLCFPLSSASCLVLHAVFQWPHQVLSPLMFFRPRFAWIVWPPFCLPFQEPFPVDFDSLCTEPCRMIKTTYFWKLNSVCEFCYWLPVLVRNRTVFQSITQSDLICKAHFHKSQFVS